MALVVASRLLGIVLATTMGLVPLAPAEHVHEAEEHGHHERIVHRHAESHVADHHSNGHENVLDDEDGPVLTASTAFNLPQSPARAVASPPAVVWLPVPPPTAAAHDAIAVDDPLIHGPPRAPA
ncbi:MAG: hypothetical protein ABL986_13900, partial [Vicinamibacterales bacterium]